MRIQSSIDRTGRNRLLISLLIGLFIIAQFAAGAHASEHMFHAADSSCIVMLSAENNSPTVGIATFRPSTDGFLLIVRSSYRAPLNNQTTRVYPTRAPPRSAS
ncbi:MAG: hypothetical protein U9N50_02855 [Pseudomonadota bacterium]|nr:hypothetical protein [Pseudomonadota bacterium]